MRAIDRAHLLIDALDADAAPNVLSGLAKVYIIVTANEIDRRRASSEADGLECDWGEGRA